MESYIYLIRHGITEGVEKDWFYGWLDLPLTENGYRELNNLKENDIYPKLDLEKTKFYISGLTRTKQTLETIFGDVPYIVIEDLKEINFGDWEGSDFNDLKNQKKWKEWMENPSSDFRFPNGECQSEFQNRVQIGFDKLLDYHKDYNIKNTVVVIHGGVISQIMVKLFGNEDKLFLNWTPKAGRGYKLILENNIPVGYERI